MWAAEVRSEDAVRPHRLDERVLTSLTEALDADPRAFDADVVGDSEGITARFDLCANDEPAAIRCASEIFLAAMMHALGTSDLPSRPEVRVREHVPA